MKAKRKAATIRIDNKKKRVSGSSTKTIDPDQCIYFFTSWQAVREINEKLDRNALGLDNYLLPIRVVEVIRDSNIDILHVLYGESTVKIDDKYDLGNLFPRHLKKNGRLFMFYIKKDTEKSRKKPAESTPLKIEFIKEIAEGEAAYEVQRRTMCGCRDDKGNCDKKCHFDRCSNGHLLKVCNCNKQPEIAKAQERDYDSQGNSPVSHEDPEECEVQFYTWLVLPAVNKYLEDSHVIFEYYMMPIQAITPTIMNAKEVEMNILYGESTFKRGKIPLKTVTRENSHLKPDGRRFKFHVKCFWNNRKRWRRPDRIEIHVTKKISPELGQMKPVNFYCGEDCDYFTR